LGYSDDPLLLRSSRFLDHALKRVALRTNHTTAVTMTKLNNKKKTSFDSCITSYPQK
jgi:predicted solute-binding protein